MIDALFSWHVSTFNAKSLPIPWEWKDKIDEWIAKMGYHFVIDEVETAESVKRGDKLSVRLVIDNVGVAPIYKRLPLYIRLKMPIAIKCLKRTWIYDNGCREA
ncbi:MAG: DUF4832 domain-containing protein [Clostridia bacterium]|nr:DUF4832 domain-containing protein [Clostridia bacterium]